MEEVFATFDQNGVLVGSAARSLVHREGLWHRSVQVFVFDRQDRLLMQLRAAGKDVCPDLWDESVGEHLLPGETYPAGAMRGLREELGIRNVKLHQIGEVQRGEYRDTQAGIWDRELRQAYRCSYAGPIHMDAIEVADVRWWAQEEVRREVCHASATFTPWFIKAVNTLPIWNR